MTEQEDEPCLSYDGFDCNKMEVVNLDATECAEDLIFTLSGGKYFAETEDGRKRICRMPGETDSDLRKRYNTLKGTE